MWATQLPPLRMGLQPLCLLLFPLLATWQVAETDSVTLTVLPGLDVRSGTNVTLRCVAKITSSSGKALAHQYTFYRDNTMVSTENSTTASLDYRIQQARVANSGSYKCKVSILEKDQESSSKKLKVTGLQTPVLFLNKSVVAEGEKVMAFCNAPKEIGPFYFYFHGSKEDKKVPTSSNLVKAELDFVSHGNKSLSCEYDIDLQPGLVRSSKSNTVRVYVQELSIRPTIEIEPNTNVIEGDAVNITCNVSGPHHDPITVHVSKDENIKKSGKNVIVYRKIMLSQDSGVYECNLERGNVLKKVKSFVRVSELFSKPALTMNPSEVFETESFVVTCYSPNVSTLRIRQHDVKYILYRNGVLLTPGNFAGRYSAKADTSLNGNYSCVAVANMITKFSNAIVFKAKVLVSKPLIKVYDKVIVGKKFEINCHCEDGSLPINYTLLNNKVKITQRPVRKPTDFASFTVTIRRKEDIKNFTCEAENNGHSSKKESDTLNITVIEPVSKPSLLVMPGLGDVTEGEELYLVCSVTKGSPPITFNWYRDDPNQPLFTTETKQRSESFVLGQAKSDHRGSYHCMADNPANEAIHSQVATISVSLARWKKVLIAAFCVLLLVLLIVFGCYRYRAKRGKRETATELSVKPSSPKSEDSLTVSLAHDTEVYNAHKDGGDAGGRSVWSERESDSDTENQSSEEALKEPDVEYTEVVHPQPADNSRAPVKKGTDTVYSELQNSPQDVADQSGYGSVEYAQLNHDLPEAV